MKRKRDFIKERRTIRKLTILLVLQIVIFASMSSYVALTGRLLTFAEAATTIGLAQKILPIDPVEEISSVEKETNRQNDDFASSDFRVIAEIPNREQVEDRSYVAKSSIVTFRGKTIYPNSTVILEIHSDPFVTTVKSDGQGNWTWTNYGHPLEKGQHYIQAYSVSPFDLSGQRDIFTESFSFLVDPIADATDIVLLDKNNYTEDPSGTLGERIRTGNIRDIYVFDTILLNKVKYSPGDQIILELIFNPLAKNSGAVALVKYQLFYYGEDEARPQVVSEWSDKVQLDGGGAYIKKFLLKKEIMPGGYFLKVSADINGTEYVQVNRLEVSSRIMIQIGIIRVDQQNLVRAITWNVVIFFIISILITSVLIFEFRRFMVYHGISGSIFRRSSLISK